MKCYMTEERMEFVGKAWEIRTYLQRLKREEAGRRPTVAAYLSGLEPKAATSGSPRRLER